MVVRTFRAGEAHKTLTSKPSTNSSESLRHTPLWHDSIFLLSARHLASFFLGTFFSNLPSLLSLELSLELLLLQPPRSRAR